MPFDYSKVPHEDVTDRYFYVNLPLRFFQDRAAGRITPLMFDCLVWAWQHAGYRTGIVERASAGMILRDLWPNKKGSPSLSSVQRALNRCGKCGYISLPKAYIHGENYRIFCHGYVVASDGRKLAIYPKETVSYKKAKGTCDESSDDLWNGLLNESGSTSAPPSDESCDEPEIPASQSNKGGYKEPKERCDEHSDEPSSEPVTNICGTNDEPSVGPSADSSLCITPDSTCVTGSTGSTNQLINEVRAGKSVSKSENGNLSLQGQERSEGGSSREKKAKGSCEEKSGTSRQNYENSPSKKSGRKTAGKNHDKHPARKNQHKHSAPAADGVKTLNKLFQKVEADADRIIEEGFRSWKS
jgi:hypothetical protein